MTDEAISIKKEIATPCGLAMTMGRQMTFCIYISPRLKLAPLREIWFNAIGGRRWKRKQNP